MKRSLHGLSRGPSPIPLAVLLPIVVAVVCLQSRADVKQNPYEGIIARNPFGLKPLPPPPDPSANIPAAPPAPPATVELTGITSILKSKRCLLEIVPGPGKPMVKPILSEGERVESVEVVSINVEKNEVVIKNGTLITNLTFKVVKTPAAATAAAAMPGVAPAPGAVPPPPVHRAAGPAGAQPFAGGRNGVMVGGGAPPVNPASLTAGTDAAFRSIPSRNMRTTAPEAGAISPEEQAQIIERQRYQHNIPLPPTMLNPTPTYPATQPGLDNQNPNLPRTGGGFPPLPGNFHFPPVPGGTPQQ